MNKTILSIGILVILLAAGAFAIFQTTRGLEPVAVAGWETGTDETSQITFQYPKQLSESYIHVNDWPPAVQKKPGTLICRESPEGSNQQEKTKRRSINGRDYCVISTDEGAAGSTYGQYLYRGRRDDGIVTVLFTLRYDQCDNFVGDRKAQCERERSAFNLDQLVDQVVMSVADTSR